MKLDIARAWKDELYRQSLSEEKLLTLPESPVGGLELSDDILDTVYGGCRPRHRERHRERRREHRREHHEHHEHHEHNNSWSEDESWSSDSED
jgi:mersacidin/lichenicidin family type 2 lantibiotic